MTRIKENNAFYILIILIMISSCIASKNDKKIRKKSKIIREQSAIIKADKIGEFNSIYLNIRDNHVFDLHTTGIIKEYYSGTWEYSNDSIFLDYFNDHNPSDYKREVYFDKSNMILYLSFCGIDSIKLIPLSCNIIERSSFEQYFIN